MRQMTRRRRDAIVVILGLTVGIGATLLIDRHQPSATEPIRQLATGTSSTTSPTTGTSAPATAETPVAPASAVAAVEGFLTAEQQGEIAESFNFLSRTDRQAHGSAAGWEAAHADLIPPIESFSVRSGMKVDGSSEVITDVTFTASLDEVSGLIPGEALVTWRLVPEAGGWRISLSETTVEPSYPPEPAAREAARRWVMDRTECASAVEYEGGLLGNPGLADSLCGAVGPAEVGQPGPLEDQVDAAQFIGAFGPEFDRWGRSVAVDSPTPMRVVLAPVGDQWVVIGVLPEEAG